MSVPSQHLWSLLNPAEPPPAFSAAPADDAAKDRILLLAKYAMQNGPSFVDMVRRNQGSNPEYAFLNPGGEDHMFFQWALLATGCGIPVEQPPPQGWVAPPPPAQQQPPPQQLQQPPQYGAPPQQQPPPQQQQYSGVPPQQQYAQQSYPHPAQYQPPHHVQQQQPARPAPPPIPPEFAAGFSQVLDNLSGSKVDLPNGSLFPRESIKASQGWFMTCAAYAPGLAYMMAARAVSLQEFDKLLHLIYLANEILFKAMQQQQGIAKQEEGQTHLEPAAAAAVTAAFLPAASVIMAAAFAAAQAAGNAEGSGKLDKMLSFWRDKGVFDANTTARFQHEMHNASASALLLANYPPPGGHLQQQQQQQPGWGVGAPPLGTPPQPLQTPPPQGGWGPPPPGVLSPHMPPIPQGPVSGGWGAPAPFQQQQQQYPPQPPPGGWGGHHQPPPTSPWGAVPPAVPPMGIYPGGPVPPPQQQYSMGALQPPFPPPGVAPIGHPDPQGPMGPVTPQPEPVSSLAFPPGLLPQLCREKSKYSEPYAAIEPVEIDKAGLPPPPEKDAYLKSRVEKFMLELHDYKPGSSRADLEESRAAARAQQGLEPDSDEELALGSTGSRLARRKALGMGASGLDGRRRRRALGPVVGGMAEDGSYVGPGGGRGERLGLGAHSSADTTAQLGDVYSSYRKLRSTSYHQMIVEGAGVSNMAKGG